MTDLTFTPGFRRPVNPGDSGKGDSINHGADKPKWPGYSYSEKADPFYPPEDDLIGIKLVE